jgi:hypothetical protein
MQPKLGRNEYGQGIFPALGSMTTTILRTLHYRSRDNPYPATVQDIMTPILQAGLPYSGIARTFPTRWCTVPSNTRARYSQFVHESGISHERILKYSHIDDDIPGNSYGRPWNNSSSRSGAMDPHPYRMQIFPARPIAGSGRHGSLWMHTRSGSRTPPDFLLSRANDQLLIPLFHERAFATTISID